MSKPTELPTCRSLPQNHFQTLPNFLPVSTSKMAGEHQKKSIIARASILYYSHLFCVCSDVDGIYRDRSQAWIKSLSRGFHLSCGLHYTTKTGEKCFSFGSSRNLPLREGTRVENLRTFRGRLLDSVQTSSFLARGSTRHLHAGQGLCVELLQFCVRSLILM